MSLFNLLSRINLRSHLSFVPIGLGAISFLALNLFLKASWSASEYGQFSLLMTLFSLINSFGLLGTNHALLRIGQRNSNSIFNVPAFTKNYVRIVVLFISIIASYLIGKFYFTSIPVWVFLIFTTSSLIIVLQFNIERVNANFIRSQIISNSWRIFLFLGSILVITIKDNLHFKDVFLILVIVLFFTAAISLKRLSKTLAFGKTEHNGQKSQFAKFSLAFLFNISTLSFLNYGVNLIIEATFGLEELGRYFFISTVFLYPFNLMQTYIGFKELVYFKTNFNLPIIYKKVVKTTYLGVIMIIILVTSAFIMEANNLYNFEFTENFPLITVVVLIGLTKLFYALFSSILGAQGDLRSLYRVNIGTLILLVLCSLLTLVFDFSLIQILIGILIIWIIRTISISLEVPRVAKLIPKKT